MSTREPKNRSRRRFLRGVGGSVLGLPLLEYFRGSQARAAHGGAHPQRFICVTHQQGWVPRLFWPGSGTGGSGSLQLSELLLPLSGYESRMLVIRGVDNRASQLNVLSDGHTSPETSLLTCDAWAENIDGSGNVIPGPQQASFGVQGAASFDQVLARRLSSGESLPSVNLAVGNYADVGAELQTTTSMKFAESSGERLNQIVDPRLTYEFLFGAGGGGDPGAATSLLARRLSVLDAVHDNFASLRTRLGREDRERLDSHAEKVRRLEMRLQNLSSCSASPPSVPDGYNHITHDDVSSPLQIELMVLALACGMSNVATLQFTDGHGNAFDWIDEPNPVVPPPPSGWDESAGEPPSGYSNWHDMVHRGMFLNGQEDASEPGLAAGFRFYAEQLRVLLDALASTPDLEGTLLDSTCVLHITEFGNGAWHDTTDIPVIVIGSLGSDVEMGRYIDLRPGNGGPNEYCTNQLYTSLLHGFGFEDASFGRIGSHTLEAAEGTRQVDLLPGTLPL